MCTFLSFLQEKIRQNLQFSLLKIEIKKTSSKLHSVDFVITMTPEAVKTNISI